MPAKKDAAYWSDYRRRKREAKESGMAGTVADLPADPQAFVPTSKQAVKLTGTAFQLDRALARVSELEEEVKVLKRQLAERGVVPLVGASRNHTSSGGLGGVFERLPDEHFNTKPFTPVPRK